MKSKIKAFIFDIGGVLWLGMATELKLKRGVHELIAKELGLSIDQYFDSIDTTYAKGILGQLNEEQCLKIMARNLKTTPKTLKKLFVSAYKKYFVLNKKLLKKAEQLKEQGYKVAILSDQWPVSKDALVTKEFRRIFNPVIISCDVGMRKPELRTYRLTLKKMRANPRETVFIDNQDWNIKPAKKIGLDTILFRNNRQTIKDIDKFLK